MGKHSSTQQIIRRSLAILGLTALGLSACGADDDAADADIATGEFDEPAEESSEESASVEMEEFADDGNAGDVATEPSTGGSAVVLGENDFGRDIIRRVGIVMQTPDVRATTNDVRRLAVDNGGAVFSSDVTIGDVQEDGSIPGGGTIVVRIPPQDLGRLVEDLDGLGIVSQITQDSEDVTEQLVDLEIRIRQARAGIERIETLLGSAVELDDVFSIERELNSRQVELERLLAAQRSTEDRVSLATLTASIEYREPNGEPTVLVEDESDGIGDAFSSGWSAFVGVLFAVGFVLAVTAPFLVLTLVVGAMAWLVSRRLRRPARTHPSVATAPPVEPELVTPDGGSASPEE